MAKEKEQEQVVNLTPANEVADLKAQVNQLSQLVMALLGNKTPIEDAKSRHEVLLEKAEQISEKNRIIFAQFEKDLQDGPRKWWVEIVDATKPNCEPQMSRIVGAEDEANAERKFKKYHGILSITEPTKQITVSPYKRINEEQLIPRVKEAIGLVNAL